MLEFPLDSFPETRVAGRIRYEKGWQNENKGLRGNALYYVYSGCLRFTIGERSIPVTAGSAFLLAKGSAYSVRAEEDSDYCYFHFRIPEARGEERVSKKAHYSALPPREKSIRIPLATPIAEKRAQLEHLASGALKHIACRKPYDKVRLDLAVLRILLLLAEDYAEEDESGETLCGRNTYLAIREHIEMHYTEPLSLSEISRRMEISPQYAARVFRRHAGCSVTAFLQSVRLTKSQELLRYTPLSISEIAFAVGFSSPYYYSRLFSRICGTSPSEFRHAARMEL